MPTKKTNNSHLLNKSLLRLNHLPDNPVVLDCFGGASLVWKAVKELSGKHIQYIGIDKVDYGDGFYLRGDNLDYLRSMDLTRFSVIDLDAYGCPYEQLKILFARCYHGRVFVTFIQSVMGIIPNGILLEIGFTTEMIKAIPTIYGKRGWEFFKEWLAQNKVGTITHRSHNQKHYLVFDV